MRFHCTTSPFALCIYKFVLTLCAPPPGGGGVLALISTFENFLAIEAIPTKLYHFHYNLLENRIPENVFVKGISCCHGNQISDAMFSQVLTF